MPDQIYIGNFAKGLTLNRLPFNIDNDAFPTMFNFYSWRGRAKRKRGTLFLGRLQRQVQSVATGAPPLVWQIGTITTLDGSGNGSANLISLLSLPAGTSISPGSITLSDGTNTYDEPTTPDGTLVGVPGGVGTINYATGALTITGGAAGGTLVGTFSYFPDLPVLGLRDFLVVAPSTVPPVSKYPLLIAFDQKYAYQINQSTVPPFFYSVSYYKATNNPVVWSGEDYQQFWTTNYSGALWATNNKPGLHFLTGTYTSGSGTAVITFNFKSGGVNFTTLLVGDVLWFNEWAAGGVTLNGINGTVSSIAGAASGNYVVTFSGNQTVSGTGIVQLMTNSIPGQDGIRWYDGDPTAGTGLPTTTSVGWVNFSPPLTASTVSINNTPEAAYYLVGALAILPFKDRLLFFSPWIQASDGLPIQLADTVIWSWNGTPFYEALVPSGETYNVTAYYVDQTGKGGWISAGIAQSITTVTSNEDVLLIGFTGRQTRFVYTGDDLSPFLFFNINSEFGSSSTFSGITLDRGGLSIGSYGIFLTTQQSTERIDLDIPDSVFQIQALNNGAQRVSGVRDFFREWIYFCYPTGTGSGTNGSWKFPAQTFFYNYRDNTWGIFRENFTAQGLFRKSTYYTWASLTSITWAQWVDPWNSGSETALFPSVVAGNPQGYVLIKDQQTGEGTSGSVNSLSNSGGYTQITSVNHCVNANDYLLFLGALGMGNATITAITQSNPAVITASNSFVAGQSVFITEVVGMTELNNGTYTIISANSTSLTINVDSTLFTAYSSDGNVSSFNGVIGMVTRTPTTSTFVVDIPFPAGTYGGLGTFTRLSQPLIQSKQFAFYWEQGKKVRLSVQKYLMDTTANSQVTVNIYLSQDPTNPWNEGTIVPATTPETPDNEALIYSQLMYTCPESENIGLTPANVNLQMPTAVFQKQIWHRFNTSLIGDSVQLGITLSDAQMRNVTYATSEITLHGIVLSVQPSSQLA